jgi:hypothetical protein
MSPPIHTCTRLCSPGGLPVLPVRHPSSPVAELRRRGVPVLGVVLRLRQGAVDGTGPGQARGAGAELAAQPAPGRGVAELSRLQVLGEEDPEAMRLWVGVKREGGRS